MSDDQLRLDVQYVALSPEEKVERGTHLAALLRERTLMALEHKDRRAGMKEEAEGLEQQIAQIAHVLLTGQEERPIAS